MHTVSADPGRFDPRDPPAATAPAGAVGRVGPTALRPTASVDSALLGVVAAGASAATWFLPDVLHGAPAMDTSARGIASIMLGLAAVTAVAVLPFLLDVRSRKA